LKLIRTRYLTYLNQMKGKNKVKKELKKKKIVKKQRDNKDGRIVRVALTKKGKKLRYDFMARRVLEVKGLLDRLTEQEQSDLVNALETAAKIFQKI